MLDGLQFKREWQWTSLTCSRTSGSWLRATAALLRLRLAAVTALERIDGAFGRANALRAANPRMKPGQA